VNGSWRPLWTWLARTPPTRRATEVLFRSAARRHLARLDTVAPARRQFRTLLGLVHQASGTRFGREHDFGRVRTADDFRRLVPLTTRAGLWRDYWDAAFPFLGGTTWPAPVLPVPGPHNLDEIPRPVCLSPALQAAHRAGLHTALALAANALPHARLLGGDLLLLRDETTALYPDPAALLQRRLPALLRPCATRDASELSAVVDKLASRKVSCVIGPAERVVALAEQLHRRTGAKHLRHAWPSLAAVLCGVRGPGARESVREAVGPGVLVLETLFRPEGPVAVEDPRLGGLRLLTDHGVFFEFVPAGSGLDAPRLTLDEVRTGVDYELGLTSPAGLWACRVGRAVRFERLDPPVMRLVEAQAPSRVEVPAAVMAPVRAPHRQGAGTAAALPETPAHTPWSALAGRG
jgi:hypothetical protein